MWKPRKIISGGETGVEIGALVGARRTAIPTGGCSVRNFNTEKGSQRDVLKNTFNLVEHPSPFCKDRTIENIVNSDASLIITTTLNSERTGLAIRTCSKKKKPFIIIDPDQEPVTPKIMLFLNTNKPCTLNITGSKESHSPGISIKTANIVESIFADKSDINL